LRVAHRSAIPAEVDRIHHRQRAPDAKDEPEKKTDDGGKREVHSFDHVMSGLSSPVPAAVREPAIHPEDNEQGSKNQDDEEESDEELAHVILFIGGTGRGLIGLWR